MELKIEAGLDKMSTECKEANTETLNYRRHGPLLDEWGRDGSSSMTGRG